MKDRRAVTPAAVLHTFLPHELLKKTRTKVQPMSTLTHLATEMLFPSPVAGYEVPDAAALNAGLIRESERLRETEPGMQVSNQLGWHSERDIFTRPEPEFQLLKRHLVGAVLHTIGQHMPGFTLTDYDVEGQAWININGQGAFNTPHDHAGFHWSGCYYVAVPEQTAPRSGFIEFLDPRGAVGGHTLPGVRSFASKFQIKPKAGTLLIFPAYLRHWVYPNLEEQARISVAFNARVVQRQPQPSLTAGTAQALPA